MAESTWVLEGNAASPASILELEAREALTVRWTAGLAAALLLGLAFVAFGPLAQLAFPPDAYAFLHAFLEMGALAIAAQIAAIGWTSHEMAPNRNFIVFGCLFAVAGTFDFLHLMSYQGMPDFLSPSNPSKAIYFWLTGRYASVAALAAVVLLPWRPGVTPFGRHGTAAAAAVVTVAVAWIGLLHPERIPVFFVPGEGLTTLKITFEYALVAILILLAAALARANTAAPRPYHVRYLLAGIVAMAVSELCFTLYIRVSDSVNLLGHAYKLLSYLLFYRAVFVEQIRLPYRRVRESDSRFRRLMEASPDGIAIVDRCGRMVGANRALAAMFGCDAAGLAGTPLAALIPEHGGEDRELLVHRRDGSHFPIEVSRSLVGAGCDWTMVICRDISERKRAEAALRQQKQELRALTDNAPDVIARFDRNLRRVYINRTITRYINKPIAWFLGRTHRESECGDQASDLWERHLKAVFTSGEPSGFDFVLPTPHGEVLFRTRLAPEFGVDGSVEYVVAISRDITAIAAAEADRMRLAAVLESSPDLVALVDRDRHLLYVNPSGRTLLGLGQTARLPACDVLDWFSAEARERLTVEGEAAARQAGIWRGEVELAIDGGKAVAVALTLIAHRDANGDIAFWSYLVQDISRRKQLEEQLLHQATHDALTGLPNRTLLVDRLGQAMAHAERRRRMVGVLVVGIEGLKAVNNTLGHLHGDRLLQQVGHRLEGAVRAGDTVARVSGETFVILLDDLADGADLLPLGEKLIETLRPALRTDGREVFLTATIGAALFPGDGSGAEEILRNADIAMFEAKKPGRAGFCRFEPAMNRGTLHRLQLLAELRHAVEERQFVLYYQPKVDLASGTVCGLEALIRWQHPERGLVPPDQFIPLAEESGLILPMGQWVLRMACAQAKAWQLAGMPPLAVAINLSPHQFRQDDLVDSVARTLRETGLAPQYLELEVTESQVMDNIEHSLRVLNELKQLGVSIAIDDFGTGYSSLAYLRRLPVDCIKIDRSFVTELPDNENDAAIAAAIISMAHRLGLVVVAEGVETDRQLEFLRSLHCEEMQGYLCSRPLPAGDLERMLWDGVRLCPLGERAAA